MVETKSDKGFTIEDMESEDIDEATMMRKQSWIDTYVNDEHGVSRKDIEEYFAAKFDSSTKTERIDRFEKGVKEGTFKAWIARDAEGSVVGAATPFVTDEGVQRVGSIYVDKSFHGTGLGSQLMQNVVDWLDPSRPIQLEVATYNERAKAFYRKWGFEEVEGSEKSFWKIPEIVMVRKPQNERLAE